MARKKLNIAYIADDAVRRATFMKRRKGLIKKVRELSTLCDVPACIIIYGPDEAQPEVWPSKDEARCMLLHFRQLPELVQNKKMVNQEQFLHQRVKKLLDQYQKQERKLRELEMAMLMYECVDGRELHDIGVDDMINFHYFVDMRIMALCKMMESAEASVAEVDVDADAKETDQTQAQKSIAAPPRAMDVLAVGRRNWYSDMCTLRNVQMFMGNNGGASSSSIDPNLFTGDMTQPYLNNIGSPCIDPNLFHI